MSGDSVLEKGLGVALESRVPDWFPSWAARLSDLYFSGTTSMFLLHGAVQDFVRGGKDPVYGSLADFLAEQIFGRWELVLHYDLAREGWGAAEGHGGACEPARWRHCGSP
jgi:hypothetical protein